MNNIEDGNDDDDDDGDDGEEDQNIQDKDDDGRGQSRCFLKGSSREPLRDPFLTQEAEIEAKESPRSWGRVNPLEIRAQTTSRILEYRFPRKANENKSCAIFAAE